MKFRYVSAPFVLAATVAMAGCAPSTPPAAATSGEVAVETATATAEATIAGAEFSRRIGDAMAAAKSGRQTITIDTPQGAVTGDGVFAINGASSDAHVNMTVAGKALELVSTGGVMYLKGLLPARSPKPWVKIDPTATDALSKSIQSQVQDASDPRGVLEAYQNATVSVVSRKDGITQYEVSGLGGAATAAAGVFFFVDDKGLPTQITTNIDGSAAHLSFSDWGAPVTITAPPASQVSVLPGA